MTTALNLSGLGGGGGPGEGAQPATEFTQVTDPSILKRLGVAAPAPKEPAAPAGGVSGGAAVPNIAPNTNTATVQIPPPQSRQLPFVTSEGFSEVTNPDIIRRLGGQSTTVETPYNQAVSNQLRKNLSNNVKSVDYSYDKFKGGVADTFALAGLPASAIGSVLESVGVIPKGETFGGYAMIRRGYRNLFDVEGLAIPTDRYGNVKKSDEILGTVAEFIGGSMIPGAGAIATAERKLATALTQIAASATAGTFAVEVKSFAENYGPTLGISKERSGEIGFMLGSFGGSAIPFIAGQAIVKSMGGAAKISAQSDIKNIADLRKKFSKEEMEVMSNNAVKKEILTSIESYPNSLENAARAIELKSKIDKFTPLPAQMTDSPGLVGMYNQVAKTNPAALGKAQAVEASNIAALEAFKLKTFPVAEVGVGVTTGARATLQAKSYINSLSMNELKGQLTTLSDKFIRTVDNTKIGTELRGMYWANRESAKGVLDAEIGSVYKQAAQIGLKEDMSVTKGIVQAIVSRDQLTFQDTPAVLNKILTKYGEVAPASTKLVPTGLLDAAGKPAMRSVTMPASGSSTASFEELHSLYKELNKDINAAQIAGQGMKVNQMQEVKQVLQTQLSKYSGKEYGDFATNFSNFNKNYSSYAGIFKEGLGGQIAQRTRMGVSTDAEDIVRKLVVQAGDKRQGLLDFSNVYGGSPKAAELLHDGVLDMFSKAAVVDGMLKPAAARRWMSNHKEMLQEMPELEKALRKTTESGNALVNRRLELKVEAQLYQKTIIAKIAQHSNAEDVINLALRDDRYMKGLLYTAETPENKKAVARGILDYVWAQKDPTKYLEENAIKLKPALDALGENHWENLRTLGLGKTVNDRVKAPSSVPISKLQDIGESTVGVPVKGLLSRIFSPIMNERYVITDVAGRYFFKTKMEGMAKIRESAMLDPNMAEAVLEVAKREALGLKPTTKNLLDLQRMSFAHGIMSFTTAVSMQNARVNDLEEKDR